MAEVEGENKSLSAEVLPEELEESMEART
eukprot:SAG11_NODE_25621_length_356_cov_0.976654_2_plen_28_part_01